MTSFGLLIKSDAPDERTGVDIASADHKIAAIEPNVTAEAAPTIDATGRLVAPPSSIAISTWTRRCRSANCTRTSPARC